MLQVRHINKEVAGKYILRDLSCDFDKGLTFIVGDSGAGKSTLLNILGTLDEASSGEVLFNVNGEEAKKIDDVEYFRAQNLGFVFQESNLINGLTVYQNIELAVSLSSIYVSKEDILELLEEFNLEHIVDEKVQFLSGGEKQRVAIVRALIKGAEIILADEPTGNLDQDNSNKVFRALKRCAADKIVIVVTHNLEKAKEYADKIVTIRDGKIVKEETYNPTVHNTFEQNSVNNNIIPSSGLAFSFIKLLSLNNIKRVKGKFISIVLTLAIALLAVEAVLSMNITANNTIDDMNYAYFDADVINVYPELADNNYVNQIVMGEEGIAITEDELRQIDAIADFSAVVPINPAIFYINGTYDEIDIKHIKLDEFFENRIMDDSIEGAFPLTDNEMIIGEDVAEKVFGDNAIGQTLVIKDDYGNNISLNIVGINHQKTIDGIYNNYICYDALLGLSYTYYSSEIYLTSRFEDSSSISYSSDTTGVCTSTMENAILYGERPSRKGEIAVSIDAFCDLYYKINGNYVKFVAEDFIDPDDSMKQSIHSVLDEDYYMSANDAYEVAIVGIHDGEDSNIIVTSDWLNDIFVALPKKVQCYTKNMKIAENFDGSELPEGYTYESYYAERFSTVVRSNDTFKILFIIILIITIALTLALMNSYVKISLSERMYEIGILQSLGSTASDIQKVLTFDNVILGVCAGIVANAIYVIFANILPHVSGITIGTPVHIFTICAVTFTLAVLLCTLSCYMKIKKLTKMKPIDSIRKRV